MCVSSMELVVSEDERHAPVKRERERDEGKEGVEKRSARAIATKK
jgi:hypothetical protein